MSKQIYINLPVASVKASRDFYTQAGFTFNELFSNETAACLIIADNIYAMLITKDFFKEVAKRDVADTATVSEAVFALSQENDADVDTLVEAAIAAGGTAVSDPSNADGMYSRNFRDLDGHQWEVMHMDMGN